MHLLSITLGGSNVILRSSSTAEDLEAVDLKNIINASIISK